MHRWGRGATRRHRFTENKNVPQDKGRGRHIDTEGKEKSQSLAEIHFHRGQRNAHKWQKEENRFSQEIEKCYQIRRRLRGEHHMGFGLWSWYSAKKSDLLEEHRLVKWGRGPIRREMKRQRTTAFISLRKRGLGGYPLGIPSLPGSLNLLPINFHPFHLPSFVCGFIL